MKRLAHSEISKTIEFEENIINTMVIENKDFFRAIAEDLSNGINGMACRLVLSDDFSPVDISKNIEVLSQFVPFEINKKSLLNKIASSLEKEAVNESHYAKTMELLAEIERYLDDLTFDYSYDFEYEKLNIGSILKSVGVALSEDYENGLEKILDYMQLVREFDKDKIFVFINLRSYYSDEIVEIFTKDIISRKFTVMFIDNCESKLLENEKRLIIDKDLCEIFLKNS